MEIDYGGFDYMKQRQKDLMTTGGRLLFAMERAGFTSYEKLGEKVGCSASTISNIINDISPINAFTIRFALVLNVDPVWLETGIVRYAVNVVKGYYSKDINDSPQTPAFQPWVPVYEWDEIGKEITKRDVKKFRWEQQPVGSSPATFALIVYCVSMYAPYPRPDNFWPAEVIFVDPLIKLFEGCYAVIQLKGSSTAILRRYVKDGSDFYFKPLNPSFPAILFSEDIKIHGVFYKSLSSKKPKD